MSTIQGRLLRAFFVIIATLSVASLMFFLINLAVIQQYKSISDNMIAGYRMVDNMSIMVDAFNRFLQSAGTSASATHHQTIDTTQQEIRELTQYLDAHITEAQLRSDYLGFRGSIEQLTIQIDDSLERFAIGGVKDYFADYNKADKLYSFVRENGTSFVFSQLKYASSIRDRINQTYWLGAVFGLGALTALTIGCIFFVLRFSRRLTTPLKSLSMVAERIAGGEMGARLGQELVTSRDEIGSLSKSFQTMIIKLLENIAKLDSSNKEIADTADAVKKKNNELERLNKLMVDRELKMVELKKEIAALKDQK